MSRQMNAMSDKIWLKTKEMAEALGCHRNTLSRLKQSGFFREGQHFRTVNPLSTRPTFVWHETRVLLRMNAV